jgi:UDP-glucose 4-epimerase
VACTSLRLGRLFGPGEAGGLLAEWRAKAERGEELLVYGDGQRSLDFLYIDDAARAVLAALTAEWEGGVLNIGSGVETTWRMLAEAVADLFAPPPARSPVRCVPEGDRTRCALDIAAARAQLGFPPRVGLRDGLLAWRDAETAPALAAQGAT